MSKNLLEKIIPKAFFRRMAEAAARGSLNMTIIISTEAMEDLKQDRPALLELADGGAVVLLTQASVESVYGAGFPGRLT